MCRPTAWCRQAARWCVCLAALMACQQADEMALADDPLLEAVLQHLPDDRGMASRVCPPHATLDFVVEVLLADPAPKFPVPSLSEAQRQQLREMETQQRESGSFVLDDGVAAKELTEVLTVDQKAKLAPLLIQLEGLSALRHQTLVSDWLTLQDEQVRAIARIRGDVFERAQPYLAGRMTSAAARPDVAAEVDRKLRHFALEVDSRVWAELTPPQRQKFAERLRLFSDEHAQQDASPQ